MPRQSVTRLQSPERTAWLRRRAASCKKRRTWYLLTRERHLGDPQRSKLKVDDQKALLVGVYSPQERRQSGWDTNDDALDELAGLVEAAGAEIVGRLTQIMDKPNGATMLGSGKMEQLKLLLETTDANLIVFDKDLTPAQGKNIEAETKMVVVDRSEVILDIFASRAQTHEAKLQVELAQLLYLRPRLTRMWSHLERIASGALGSARGPGEKQLELDRRLVDTRIAELRRKLKDVEKRRGREVGNRRDHQTVGLVGYTNAGKSTLMSALTGADVFIADQLFATLDTRTRAWQVPAYGPVLLSDTVGFVSNLPHHLVASFRSTLEEARHADLLLHVVDASDPHAENHIQTVHEVLGDLGIDDSQSLLVLNKVDRVTDRTTVDALRAAHEDSLSVSAVSGAGLDRLAERVASRLGGDWVETRLKLHAGNGKGLAYLDQHAEVIRSEYIEDEYVADVRVTASRLRTLTRHFGAIVDDSSTESDADIVSIAM